MGRVEGKVALVTGAARGQGRAEAVRLAEEGADILAFDICEQVPGATYEPATDEDLAETAEAVTKHGRRVIAHKGDVRNQADLDKIVADGLQQFGHVDVLVANAGVVLPAPAWEITEEEWATQTDINMGGCWRAAKAVIPAMIEAGNGGSIILTSSGVCARGTGNLAHYSAAKNGLIGLCWELAVELGPHRIRVNNLQPGSVHTKMVDYEAMWRLFTPGQDDVPMDQRRETTLSIMARNNLLPTPWVEPEDLAQAALFLASDESRMVTGTRIVVDAGYSARG